MINYHKGCLFEYIDTLEECDIFIPHVVNNINKMGSGFVVPLYTRWPKVKSEYHEYCDFYLKNLGFFPKYMLGSIQTISVSDATSIYNRCAIDVVNMFAQDGVISKSNPKPIQYNKLAKCIIRLKDRIDHINTLVCTEFVHSSPYKNFDIKIVAPKFGAGLAGGDWTIIEKMIKKYWSDFDVTICCKE